MMLFANSICTEPPSLWSGNRVRSMRTILVSWIDVIWYIHDPCVLLFSVGSTQLALGLLHQMTPRTLLLGEMAGVHGATRLATHAGCSAASLTSNRMSTHKSSTMFVGRRRSVDKKPSPGRFHTLHVVASSPVEIAKDAGGRKNPLTKQDLVAHLRSGCKPKEEWRSAAHQSLLVVYFCKQLLILIWTCAYCWSSCIT